LPKGGASIMAQHLDPLHANFDVDYVIVYRFTDTSMLLVRFQMHVTNPAVSGKADARAGFARLLKALATVGLQIEVRNGDNCSLLVLVKVASDGVLNHHIYNSR
jgi:anoctamin-10